MKRNSSGGSSQGRETIRDGEDERHESNERAKVKAKAWNLDEVFPQADG